MRKGVKRLVSFEEMTANETGQRATKDVRADDGGAASCVTVTLPLGEWPVVLRALEIARDELECNGRGHAAGHVHRVRYDVKRQVGARDR